MIRRRGRPFAVRGADAAAGGKVSERKTVRLPAVIRRLRRPPLDAGPLAACLFLAMLALVAALVWAGVARAETGDVYEVRNVAVDVTAKTAAQAREQALVQGERLAFQRLLGRLTLLADRDRLPDLGREEISALVTDFAVAREKTSPVRYIASLTYHFKKGHVRRLLTDHGLSFAETMSKPVLVLPVYQAAGALLLWDDPNPWRDAWSTGLETGGLVPLVLPLGDLADVADIGAEQAVKGDVQRLAAIAKRYGAGGTMVAQCILHTDRAPGVPELEVHVTRYGTVLENQTVIMSYVGHEGESLADQLRRAVVHLVRQMEDNWKRDNLLRFADQAVVPVRVPIDSLRGWLTVRQRLAGVAVIRRAELVLLSRTEARVNLHYIGGPDQLALALQQADLTLAHDGDQWVLGLAPAAKGS
jgi:hypothetical protein